MTQQLAIRIAEELAAGLDDLVERGRFATRTEAVRAAIGELIDRERREVIGAAIVLGYERHPETAEELQIADGNLRRLIAEEPW